MSFSTTESECTNRIYDITTYTIAMKRMSEDESYSKDYIKQLKGLYFVHAYAALESTLRACVREMLEQLDNLGLHHSIYKHRILSLFFCKELDSISSTPSKNKWKRRCELFDAINSAPRTLNHDIFPVESTTIDINQINNVWHVFHMETPPIPTKSHTFLLNEYATNRNKVSHGNEPAARVGGRYSVNDILTKNSQWKDLIYHIIGSFKEHIRTEAYKK